MTKIERSLRKLNKKIYEDIVERMNEFAEVTKIFIATKTGDPIIYKNEIYGTGEMPWDTGNLSRSVEIFGVERAKLVFEIGSGVEYAWYIEHGTGRMVARMPFQKGIDKAFREYIDREVYRIVDRRVEEMLDEFMAELEEYGYIEVH